MAWFQIDWSDKHAIVTHSQFHSILSIHHINHSSSNWIKRTEEKINFLRLMKGESESDWFDYTTKVLASKQCLLNTETDEANCWVIEKKWQVYDRMTEIYKRESQSQQHIQRNSIVFWAMYTQWKKKRKRILTPSEMIFAPIFTSRWWHARVVGYFTVRNVNILIMFDVINIRKRTINIVGRLNSERELVYLQVFYRNCTHVGIPYTKWESNRARQRCFMSVSDEHTSHTHTHK